MAAALPDRGWPRGNCPILLLATTVHRSFHHHRLLPGIRPSSTQRKDVLFNPDSPRLLRTLRRGDRCFSGDRFSMSRPRPPQGACNRRGQPSPHRCWERSRLLELLARPLPSTYPSIHLGQRQRRYLRCLLGSRSTCSSPSVVRVRWSLYSDGTVLQGLIVSCSLTVADSL